jgi:hypothetical protein
MKGVIAKCLGELVQEKFGRDKWGAILEKSGLSPNTIFVVTSDVPDDAVMTVVQNTCAVLGITLQQAADAFGDYWVNTYAPKIYKSYYAGKSSAREMLLNMDNVHKMVTQSIPNAHPPRFEYEWKNDKTLVMHYKSNRGLVDFLVGLVKGVGTYFKEDLKVRKIGADKVEVIFP